MHSGEVLSINLLKVERPNKKNIQLTVLIEQFRQPHEIECGFPAESRVTLTIDSEKVTTEKDLIACLADAKGFPLRYLRNIFNYGEVSRKKLYKILMKINNGEKLELPKWIIEPFPYDPDDPFGISDKDDNGIWMGTPV